MVLIDRVFIVALIVTIVQQHEQYRTIVIRENRGAVHARKRVARAHAFELNQPPVVHAVVPKRRPAKRRRRRLLRVVPGMFLHVLRRVTNPCRRRSFTTGRGHGDDITRRAVDDDAPVFKAHAARVAQRLGARRTVSP